MFCQPDSRWSKHWFVRSLFFIRSSRRGTSWSLQKVYEQIITETATLIKLRCFRTWFHFNERKLYRLRSKNTCTSCFLDLFLSIFGEELRLDDQRLLWKLALSKNFKKALLCDIEYRRDIRLVLIFKPHLLRHESPELVDVNGGTPEFVLCHVKISHTQFAKISKMVFIKVGTVMMLTTSITTSTGYIASKTGFMLKTVAMDVSNLCVLSKLPKAIKTRGNSSTYDAFGASQYDHGLQIRDHASCGSCGIEWAIVNGTFVLVVEL